MIPPVNIKNSRRANPFGSLSFVSISLSFQIYGYLSEAERTFFLSVFLKIIHPLK